MSQFTAPETAITFDEPLIDDRFDLELFMMAPLGPSSTVDAPSAEIQGDAHIETPQAPTSPCAQERSHVRIPFSSAPSSPVPYYEQSPVPPAVSQSPVPPFTNARTWGEKLALIEHHKKYPGSVPGLIYPYNYTSTVNVNIMPEDVFCLNKKVCCVRCGAAIYRCLSRKGGCASKKRGVTHLVQREAVNNGGYQLDNEPSSAQGSSRYVTKEVQRLELFEEAKRKPDRFSSKRLKLDYEPELERHHASKYSDVPNLAKMGSAVYCMLCGFTYAKCMAKNPGCSRHAGPP